MNDPAQPQQSVEYATPAGADGLQDRPQVVRVEIIIYDHDKEAGKVKKSYQDIIRIARSNRLAVNYSDDVGQPLVGATDPSTVRIDGAKLYCDAEFKLEDHHKVEKLLGVRDADPAALAEVERTRKIVHSVNADEIIAMNTAVGEGKSEEEVIALATSRGVDPEAAKLIVGAIRKLRDVEIGETHSEPKAVNHAISGEVGGSEVTGDAKVSATISGTVAAQQG